MPTLAGLDGRSLNADLSGGLNLLLKTFGTGPEREEKRKAEALLAEARGLTDIIGQPTGEEASPTQQAVTDVARAFPGGAAIPDAGKTGPTLQEKQQALVRLAAINPQMAQQVRQTVEFGDKQKAAQLAQEVDKGVRMATIVNTAKTLPEKRALLMKMAQAKAAAGEDTGRVLELRGMPEERLNLELKRMLVAGADTKTLLTPKPEVSQVRNTEGVPLAQETIETDPITGEKRVTKVEKSALPQQLIDIEDSEGNIIGQENITTGEKKLFTAAERGLPGRGTPQAKEPFFTEEPVVDKQGNPVLDAQGQPVTATFQNITEFDPNQPKGKRFSVTKMDVNGEVISKTTGLTASQAANLKVKTAKEVKQAEADVKAEEEPKLQKKLKLSDAEIKRETKRVDDALEVVTQLPNLKRARQLLKTVKTGGIDAARLRFKQFAGIEGADEGELSQNLGVAVLSQLRATFGAAFTEGEGKRLERIQAGFGKSNAANIRLLDNAIKIIERASKRGMAAAKRVDDTISLEEIKEGLAFELKPEPKTRTKKAAPAGRLKVGQTKKLGNITIRRKK
jgi:hypothetical protein